MPEELYHLGCKPGSVYPIALLFGDPARCSLLQKLVDDYELVSQHRGYVLYNGLFKGLSFTFGSLGIGGPSWVIGLHELNLAGTKTFLRVGTSGILSDRVSPGDLVIPTEILSDEFLSNYICTDKLLTPEKSLLKIIEDSLDKVKTKCHFGPVHSKDFLYMEESYHYPTSKTLEARMKQIKSMGALVTEMECATLFAFGSAKKSATAAILAAINEDPTISLTAQLNALHLALYSILRYSGESHD